MGKGAGMSTAQDETTLSLPGPEDTDRLARTIAPWLGPGDVLMLSGPIGVGKSHFARALIRARLGREEDVPSPTFTLVQTYDADGVEIWHSDLFRLTHPDEVFELGLEDAFATAICLIEWPDRLGTARPEATTVDFAQEGEGRSVRIAGRAPWIKRLREWE